jgi:hypothetical protein
MKSDLQLLTNQIKPLIIGSSHSMHPYKQYAFNLGLCHPEKPKNDLRSPLYRKSLSQVTQKKQASLFESLRQKIYVSSLFKKSIHRLLFISKISLT